MSYNEFKNKLNQRIFGEDLNYEIVLNVLKNPKRYIGLFRITNAKTKLIQNITQSCEIKFGHFIEEILGEYIDEMGYERLDKNIGLDEEGNQLNADQIFRMIETNNNCNNNLKNRIFLIEQKIRDDHDSSKKRGQYLNLIKKIRSLKRKFPNDYIQTYMWFSDDSLKKNKKYYEEQAYNNTDERVGISIFYGRELFENFFQRIDVYEELISHLKKNKKERCKEILNIPDFDTSIEIKKALLKIKQKEPKLIKKLLSNESDFVELRKELFPTSQNLKGL